MLLDRCHKNACVNGTAGVLVVAKEMICKRSRVSRLLRYARYEIMIPRPCCLCAASLANSITEFQSICKQTLWKLQTGVANLAHARLIEFLRNRAI